MKIDVQGRKKLAAKLRNAARDVQSRVNRAVREVGEDVLGKAIPRTPLEHGPLRQSGYVAHRPGEAVVGFAEKYSVWVHEMPDTNQFTTPGTHGKFLTGPFLENRERYKNHILKAARDGLK